MRHFFYLSKTETSCWLWMYAALCLFFLSLILRFTWGNHDWLLILNDVPLTTGLVEGRFSQYLLINIFLSGKILPVLNIALGFLFYTLALTLLCTRFFKFSAAAFADKLCLIAVATLPYIIEILYFHFITFSLLSWSLIIVFSLLAAQKTLEKNMTRNILLSAFLLFLAIGGYPPAACLYATAACLYIMQNLPTSTNIKKLAKLTFPFAAVMVLAFLPLPFIYQWLKHNGIMIELYNTETETFISLLQKIPLTLSLALKSLCQPQPFFSLGFKITTTGIIGTFLYLFLRKCRRKHNLLIGIPATLALLLALKLPAWLSRETAENYYATLDPAAFMVRADFYAVPCLLLFAVFYLRKYAKLWCNNLLLTAVLLMLFLNINADYAFVKAHLLGFKAENLLLERITERFQAHENYQKNQIYHITQTGEFSLRSKYYAQTPNEKYGYYTLAVPFTRYWLAAEHFNFYAPSPFAANQTGIPPELITPQMIDFINDKTAVWPSKKALFLNEQFGIIALTPAGKLLFTNQFNNLKEQPR